MPHSRQRLKERRQQRGLKQRQVAEHLGVAEETYAAWERGTSTPRVGFRPPLARLLDVTLNELDGLLTDAAPAAAGHRVPAWLDTYASLEQGAERIWAFEPLVVPGLLQTRPYAHAVESVGPGPADHADITEKVTSRIARQGIVSRSPDPLQLAVVLDESALHRVAGDRDVMADQLDHLTRMSGCPNIDLRILPFDSGVFSAAWGAFSLLSSSGPGPTMAFVENRTGLTYLAKQFEINAHMDLFTYLSGAALPPDESIDIIRTTAKEKYL